MSIVPVESYPTPRPWSMRAQAAPNVPRGSSGLVSSLRIILEGIADGMPDNAPVAIPDSSSNVTLGVCCQRLRPVGLVLGKKGSWELSPEAKAWLSSGDDLYLAAVLCANIKFMGEVLYLLQEPKRASDLQVVANDAYHLPWKKKSEVGRRLVWLRDLGLVEFRDYALSYELTDLGRSFLNCIEVVSPDETAEEPEGGASPVFEASPWAEELCRLDQDALAKRKPSIGYCPGGKAELASTISAYVSYLAEGKTKEDIESFSAESYGIKASSARSLLNMLSGIRFVERASRDTYRSTDLAKLWNQDASPLDLCYCLHASALYVFELLRELESGPKTKVELAAAAVVKYGVGGEDGSEVLKRVHFLQLAGLLEEYHATGFSITPAGLEVLRNVPVQSLDVAANSDAADTQGGIAEGAAIWDDGELLTELRLSARDSSNPSRFEKACARAFAALGFKAEWIGGSGKTDVLVSAQSAAKYAYRVTVDAKSTASGAVDETQLNFDTLVDHRKLHGAQFTVVVGCGFQGKRIVERAKKHGIVLLDVDGLCELVKLHRDAPLSARDYKVLFESFGCADLDVLNPARRSLGRSGVLLRAVMDCLASQSDDEVTGGMLSAREIYVLLKAGHSDLSPSLDEIEGMLAFLSSPLVNCVGGSKDEYYAIGSLNEASNKFGFYAHACSNR